MSPRERDDEMLKEYLEGDSELSRLYRRDADEQPDAALDAHICAQAHRAVAAKRGRVHSPFARHWMVPTSLAAVLVLSVSVVLMVPDATREPPLEVDGEREGGLAQEQAPAAVRAPTPAESLESRARSPERAGAGDQAIGTLRRESPAADRPDRAGRFEAPEEADRRMQRSDGALESKRAAESAAQPKQPISSATESMPRAPVTGRPAVQDDAPVSAMGQARKPLDASEDALPERAVQSDPAAWLRFIERLVDARDPAAARINIRAFRSQYPDYPLPADLRPLAASVEAERR